MFLALEFNYSNCESSIYQSLKGFICTYKLTYTSDLITCDIKVI
jgi:hypothetical protein